MNILFSIRHVPDQYKTQQMYDKAVDDCLTALEFVPNRFVTSKLIKIIYTVCTQMKIYSTLMKILVMLYFLVIK